MEKKITAKEYLSQIYAIDRRIKRLQQMRAQIREEMYAVRSPGITPDRVQTSATGDSLERLIAKVDSIERDIISEMRRLTAKRTKICRQIETMPTDNEKCRALLFERYVLLRSWETIAQSLEVSPRHIYRLRDRALEDFEKKYL